jgi:ATP-binding cassette subfamily F protein uup
MSLRTTWIFLRSRYWKRACWSIPGALVLVTHDRYMLDRISNVVLGLDGMGNAERFADYSQWDQWQTKQKTAALSKANSVNGSGREIGCRRTARKRGTRRRGNSGGKKKLSYMDARDYATIESRIAAGEALLAEKQAVFELQEVVTDASRLQAALGGSGISAECGGCALCALG